MLNYDSIEKINVDMKREFINKFEILLNNNLIDNSYSEIVILCIGTDRITGDCFGPLVGSKLIKKLKNTNIYNINVYGSLQSTIDYINAQDTVNKIKYVHDNACMIVIDSALSKEKNIGKLFVSNEKISLGKGLKKEKLEIGDISIKAVVGKDYKIPKYNFKILQNISLNTVMILSNIVADGIYETIKNI